MLISELGEVVEKARATPKFPVVSDPPSKAKMMVYEVSSAGFLNLCYKVRVKHSFEFNKAVVDIFGNVYTSWLIGIACWINSIFGINLLIGVVSFITTTNQEYERKHYQTRHLHCKRLLS
jgi:hypothetical protein